MVLVLFLCILTYLIIFIFTLLILSSIKLKIDNKNIDILICVLNKIPILKIKLYIPKLIKKIKKMRTKNDMRFNKDTINIIKTISPKIEKLNLLIKLGLEDSALTAFIVTIISILISNILPYVTTKENYKKEIKYAVTPIFDSKNHFEFSIKSIISIKMVHIINVIFIIFRTRRVNSNGNRRASNRRTYANSYE